jgi:hypothetical protein
MRRQITTLTFVLSFITVIAQEQTDTTITSPRQNLSEVVVKGKRTLVKMKGNAMVYKAGTLRARYAPTTAYDLLTKVPSVTDGGNSVSLIGANNLMVVIDGKTLDMEQEQICDLKHC